MFQPPKRKSKRDWKRFIIYFLIVIALYACFKIFHNPSSNNTTEKNDDHHHFTDHLHQQHRVHNSIATKKQSILTFHADNSTHHDFPWYKTAHTRPQFRANSSLLTTHLSPKERHIASSTAVLQAKKLAFHHFPVSDYQHIRGTPLSPEETAELRAKVDCWTQGEWVLDDKAYKLNHVQDPLYSTCDRAFYKTHKETESRDVYRWKPKKECAPLKAVNTRNWCKVLQGRNMLLVGDLVHYQYHEVLLDAFRDEPTVCFGELNCKDHTICKWPRDTRLRYIRNDILSTIRSIKNRDEGHPLANKVEWPFVTTNLLTSYPILLLNRVSIMGDDDISFTRRLIQTMQVIRETAPEALVIYRSSFIGHPFCNDAQGPLEQPLTDEELKRLPFGWSETKRRNAIAKAVVEAAGGLYVDLAAMTELRPDSHVGGQDCVRYCIPGPLDATVQLLYNVFLDLKLTKEY